MWQKLLQITSVTLLCVVLCGVCIQAPISVVADTQLPAYALLLKSWKELCLGLAGVLIAVALWQSGKWQVLRREPAVWLSVAIAGVYMATLYGFANHPAGESAALLVTLRIYLVVALGYSAVLLWPDMRQKLLGSVAAGMAIVGVFALLQVAVLPKDILQHIGYSSATIQPYLTVDQNPDFVRINSTLRGPNPLGAMAVIGLSLIAALLVRRVLFARWQYVIGGVVATGLLVALWSSYSRSAWLAMVLVAVVLGGVVGFRTLSRRTLGLAGVVLAVVVLGGLYVLQSDFVQHVVFHTNPASPTAIKSDHEHLDSLQSGVAHTLAYPLGTGLGSVGSPSLLTDSPRIVENQYFYIAAEAGWLGLLLYLILFGYVIWRLWQCRDDALALGVAVAGMGMAIVGLVLPVWADDTVGMTWWALAGIALGSIAGQSRKENNHARTHYQKTA